MHTYTHCPVKKETIYCEDNPMHRIRDEKHIMIRACEDWREVVVHYTTVGDQDGSSMSPSGGHIVQTSVPKAKVRGGEDSEGRAQSTQHPEEASELPAGRGSKA